MKCYYCQDGTVEFTCQEQRYHNSLQEALSLSLVSCCVCTVLVALCCAYTLTSYTMSHAQYVSMPYRKKKVQLEAKAEKHMDLAKKAALPAGWK
jgi:hypothetical protein